MRYAGLEKTATSPAERRPKASEEQPRAPLERVSDAGEDGDPLVALSDIHVAYDGRRRDPAKSHSKHVVQVLHRPGAGFVEDASGIEERRDLQVDMRRERIDREHGLAQLDVGG